MDVYATRMKHDTAFVEYGTDISIEIPPGYVGLIYPRSSISNTPFSLCNSVGVIDSGYRGEITFRFRQTSSLGKPYKPGDRVGQLIIVPYPKIELVEVTELSNSDRGTGGYGSTGE